MTGAGFGGCTGEPGRAGCGDAFTQQVGDVCRRSTGYLRLTWSAAPTVRGRRCRDRAGPGQTARVRPAHRLDYLRRRGVRATGSSRCWGSGTMTRSPKGATISGGTFWSGRPRHRRPAAPLLDDAAARDRSHPTRSPEGPVGQRDHGLLAQRPSSVVRHFWNAYAVEAGRTPPTGTGHQQAVASNHIRVSVQIRTSRGGSRPFTARWT